MSEHPLVGARLRALRSPRGHRAEWLVVAVRVEDNGYGRMVEFAYLERLDAGAPRSEPPGSRRRRAVPSLDKHKVVGRGR